MTKGFGRPQKGDLGYVLILSSEPERYAADINLVPTQEKDEDFIGITNNLELANIWRQKTQLKRAIGNYAEYWIEQIKEHTLAELKIKSVKRLANRKLVTQLEEELVIEPENKDEFLKMLNATQ